MTGKNMTQQPHELHYFFQPESMAIVGASESLYSYGTRYVQALLDIGYKGRLYAVNHTGNEVLGFKIYRNLNDIPDTLDLVSICVPARFTPDILKDCLKKKVKAAIILSAGFSESGEKGAKIEKEIVALANQGIRVMGPNGFGTYCPAGRVTIVPGGGFSAESGRIALTAQSGQMAEGIIGRLMGEGIRFAKAASYGNACNINEADLLEYLMQDEDTGIHIAYLEGVRNGRRFFEIARANAAKKPIIIWKVGLTQMGAVAAASHTGSLAGQAAAWNTFFRQTGAIKVENLEQLIDASVGFSCLPSGCGLRAALISGGGAGTVVGSDACEKAGMQLPPFQPQTVDQFRELLPAAGTSLKNPLDMGNPHPSLKLLYAVLEAVAQDESIDVIVIRRIFFSLKISKFFSGSTAPSPEEQQALLEIPVKIKAKYNKPVAVILPEELTGVEHIDIEAERREIRDYFFKHQIPIFSNEERAFTTLSHLVRFKQNADRTLPAGTQGPTATGSTEPVSKGRALFSEIIKTAASPVLDEIECKQILKQYEIDVTLPVLAKSPTEAASAADKLGYPVVMKVISPQITHKSDIGGVKLGLKTATEVTRAFDEIMAAARKKAPDATVEGISVQKMASPGLELVMGMTKDPQFGPMLMFGLGGTFVEVFQDVSFGIVPLTEQDAQEMIREVKAYRLLKGYRGQPAVDIPYLETMLLKLSALVQENPEIKEMDINPLIVYQNKALAVDARIILEEGVLV